MTRLSTNAYEVGPRITRLETVTETIVENSRKTAFNEKMEEIKKSILSGAGEAKKLTVQKRITKLNSLLSVDDEDGIVNGLQELKEEFVETGKPGTSHQFEQNQEYGFKKHSIF